MFREDLVSDVPSDPHGGEVGRREDGRGHVADAYVGHGADVLETVGLLDEAYGLLHARAQGRASCACRATTGRFFR